MQDTITITLPQPINVGSVQFTEITLTEPTMGQMRKAGEGKSQLDQLALLIQHNAKVPAQVVDQLPKRVVDECAGFFGHFTSASPTTED